MTSAVLATAAGAQRVPPRPVALAAVVADSAGLAAALGALPAAPDTLHPVYQATYDGAGALAAVEQVMEAAAGTDTAVERVLRAHLAPTAAPDAWLLLRVAPGTARPLAPVVPARVQAGHAADPGAHARMMRALAFNGRPPEITPAVVPVRIRLDADGWPLLSFLLASTGVRQVDDAILAAARTLHFVMPPADGHPRATWVTLPIRTEATARP